MCADYQSVSSNPMNNSVSKQLYSFPKSNRFGPTKEPYCQGSYQIRRGAFGNRATSFGYGNKMSMAEGSDHPPVGNYELRSEFMRNRDLKKGYAFQRESRANTLVNPEKTSFLPGPGAYREDRTLNTNPYKNLAYTLGSRFNDPMQMHKNPLGPGQYDTIPGLSSTGNYFYSKYSSSGCGKIGRAKRSSLANQSNVPGPGGYSPETKISLNPRGTYFNSKFRNMEAGRFQKSRRPGLENKNSNPGPGSYGAFTQFASLNKSPYRKRASTSGRQ